MGCRLHSATKYEVKYSSDGNFNWGQKYINPIISCLSDGDFWCDNSDYIEGATILEASRANLSKNIDKIITPNNEWENQEELNELINDMENDANYHIDRNYLYQSLKSLIEQSDNNCNYIHFCWF